MPLPEYLDRLTELHGGQWNNAAAFEGLVATRKAKGFNPEDNLIIMPDISATEAARHFSDLLDSVEHGGKHYTIVRRGKAIAHLDPITRGRGSDVKALLGSHRPDPAWSKELARLRQLIEVNDRS